MSGGDGAAVGEKSTGLTGLTDPSRASLAFSEQDLYTGDYVYTSMRTDLDASTCLGLNYSNPKSNIYFVKSEP